MELQGLIPHLEISYGVATGPYEDDRGDGAYFASGKRNLNEKQLRLDVRRDVFVSIVKVLRTARLQKTQLLIADGQAAAVACCLSRPLVVELALGARVVQHEESQELVAAWNRMDLILAREPKLGKVNPGLQLLVQAIPEMVADYPVAALKCMVAVRRTDPHRGAVEEFGRGCSFPVCGALQDVDWVGQAWGARAPLWEHHGLCVCGRKAYLFSECSECLKNNQFQGDALTRTRWSRERQAPFRRLRPSCLLVPVHPHPGHRFGGSQCTSWRASQERRIPASSRRSSG